MASVLSRGVGESSIHSRKLPVGIHGAQNMSQRFPGMILNAKCNTVKLCPDSFSQLMSCTGDLLTRRLAVTTPTVD